MLSVERIISKLNKYHIIKMTNSIKRHSFFILLIILVSSFSFIPSECWALSAYVTNVKEYANIRISPVQQSQIIGTVPLDDKVEVLDKEHDPWIHVSYHDKHGYIHDRYLRMERVAASVPSEPTESSSDLHWWLWIVLFMLVLPFVNDRLEIEALQSLLLWGIPLCGFVQLCFVDDPFWFLSVSEMGLLLAGIGYVGMLYYYFLFFLLFFVIFKRMVNDFKVDEPVTALGYLGLLLCCLAVIYQTYCELSWYNVVLLVAIFAKTFELSREESDKKLSPITQPDYDYSDRQDESPVIISDSIDDYDDNDYDNVEDIADDNVDDNDGDDWGSRHGVVWERGDGTKYITDENGQDFEIWSESDTGHVYDCKGRHWYVTGRSATRQDY